ncbi:MAG: hypothetical protein LBQ14_12075 [Treponema sp.]|jgi:hypothetical protein|nr:hypothetical protein [Treponema sp.]
MRKEQKTKRGFPKTNRVLGKAQGASFFFGLWFALVPPMVIVSGCPVEDGGSGEQVPPPRTGAPGAEETVVAKSSSPQKMVDFIVTSGHTGGEWKVYYSASGGSPAAGVEASFDPPVLTLTASGDNLLNTTYYVSVTESGKAESERLGLTVAPYTAPSAGTGFIAITFGGVPADPVEISGPATISKTAGPLTISVGSPESFDRFEWRLDGVKQTGRTSGVYTVGLSSLSLGQHHVMTAAWRGNVPYSARAVFTVTN